MKDLPTIPSHTISFPTLEAAVSALCCATFGAKLSLCPEAPTTEETPQYRPLEEGEVIDISDEWWDENRGKWEARASVSPEEKLCTMGEGGYHTPHRRRVVTLASADPDEEAERLHAHWHEAAAEATALREEVKRLAGMLDKCQEGNRGHLTKIKEITHERNALYAERDSLKAEAKLKDTAHQIQVAALVGHRDHFANKADYLQLALKAAAKALDNATPI
jgi:hypothetical protein